ncbi:MAG: tetratricopeptide repeat protein [Candidatus Sumerlaeia bacterium]|nr:tetratricopeptide repeat protein [Candidatus Sumerlaeia bacterium]
MASGDKDPIKSINERLDARTLIEAIGFRTDKMVVLGGTLKTPCMIHKDDRFSTLLVQPKKNTCKCMIATCEANREVTLVELVGLYTGKTGLDAAFEAARLCGIELDEGLRGRAVGEHIESAKVALGKGKLDVAREALAQAGALDPQNAEVPALQGHVEEKAGRKPDAAHYFAIAARMLRERGERGEAGRLLREDALRIDADSAEALCELAETTDDAAEAQASLLRACEVHERQGRAAEAVRLFERLGAALDGDPSLRVRFARALESIGDANRAVEQYDLAIGRAADDPARALELTEAAVRLRPDDTARREKLAELYLSAGRAVDAGSVLAVLGQEALGRGEVEQATGIFRRILEFDAGSVSAHEGLASVFAHTGDAAQEALERVALARAFADAGLEDQAQEEATRARDLQPQDATVRLLLAELAVASGSLAAASVEFIEAARCHGAAGQQDEANGVLARLVALAPDDAEIRRAIAAYHLESGRVDAALEVWTEAASHWLDKGDATQALDFCDRGLRAEPAHPGLRTTRLRALLVLGRSDEALAEISGLGDAPAQNVGTGLTSTDLKALVDRCPDDALAWLLLADVLHQESKAADALAAYRRSLETASETQVGTRRRALARIVELDAKDNAARIQYAEFLEQHGEGAEAAELYEKAAEGTKDTEEAERCLRRAIELLPDREESRQLLIQVLGRGKDTERLRAEVFAFADWCKAQGRDQAALSAMQKLLKAMPADSAAVERLAELHLEQGNEGAAIDVLAKFVRRMEEAKTPRPATEALQKALAIAPGRIDLREKRAALLEEAGLLPNALDEWIVCIERLLEENQAKRAIELVERCERLADEEFLRRLYRLLAERGHAARAVEGLRTFMEMRVPENEAAVQAGLCEFGLELAPQDTEFRTRLVDLYESQSQPEEALRHGLELARMRMAEEAFAASERLLNRLAKLAPQDRTPRLMLVDLHERRGEPARAAEVLVAMAEESRSESDFESALGLLARAATLCPEDSAIGLSHAECLELVDRRADAITEFARVARLLAKGNDPLQAKPIYDRLLTIAGDDLSVGREYLDFLLAIGARESASQHAVGLARRAFERGETETATDLCRHAASLVPGSAENQLQIVELLAERQRRDGALAVLLDAIETQLGSKDPDEAIMLIDRGLERFGERTDLLRTRARALAASRRKGEAIETLARVAELHVEQDEPNLAEAAWKDLIELDADNRVARRGLATLYRRDAARHADAMRCLREVIVLADPEKDTRELLEVYEELLALDPSQDEMRARFARALLEAGDRTGARDEFGRLGRSHADRGDRKTAIDYYEKALELDPENPVLLRAQIALAREEKRHELVTACSLRLASVFEKAGAFADAIAVCEGITESDPENIDARLLLASYFVRDGNKARALNVYIDAAESVSVTGDSGKAREVLARLEKLQPLGPKAHEAAGKVYLALGNETEGLTHLTQAAAMYRADKEAARALEVTDLILANTAADAETLELRAQLFEDLGQSARAADEYEKLARRRENQPEALVRVLEPLVRLAPDRLDLLEQLAATCETLGQKPEASKHYLNLATTLAKTKAAKALEHARKAEALDPDGTAPHDMLVRLYEAAGDKKAAVEECLWLGDHYANAKELKRARAILAKAAELDPENPDVPARQGRALEVGGDEFGAVQAYAAAAHLYRKAGNKADASSMMRLATSLQPDNVALREQVAQELLDSGRHDEALDEFLGIVRTQLGKGMIEESRALLDRLYEAEGGNTRLRAQAAQVFADNDIPELAAREYTAVARLEVTAGNFEAARGWARKALELRPRDLEAREALALAHKGMGEIAEACRTLRELGEALRETSSYEKAAEVYEAVTAMEPEAVDVAAALIEIYRRLDKQREAADEMSRLGQLYRRRGEPRRAVDVLVRLVEMAPTDAAARALFDDALREAGVPGRERIPNLLQLARLYIQKGAHEEAFGRFRAAIEAEPAEPKIRTDYIEALLAAGKNPEALRQSQEAVRLLVDLGAFREAGTLLSRIERIGEGNADFHLAQAQVHKARNARGMALLALEKALRLYREATNPDKQIEVLRMGVELDAQNLEMRRDLITLLARTRRAAEAVEQQLVLAGALRERGLVDLAEKEYRAVTRLDPTCRQAWQALFEARLSYGEEKDLQADYLEYAGVLLHQNDINEALHFISKTIRLNPWSIEAREKYIEAYVRIGPEVDLCEDYLVLADLYVAAERIDDGVRLYSKVMSLDPENKTARERLSETQARRKGQKVPSRPVDNPPTERPHETKFPKGPKPAGAGDTRSGTRKRDGTGTGTGSGTGKRGGAAASFLADEMESLDEEEERQALEQVVQNYRDILGANPQNANVRVKLADLYEQTGRMDEAIEELIAASETHFQKGELNPCVALCERILKVRPTEQRVRLRMKQALTKRDAMKALESAIWFEDDDEPGPPKRPGK